MFICLNFLWIWISTSHSKEISISTRKYFPSPCDAEYEESEIEERIKPEKKKSLAKKEEREREEIIRQQREISLLSIEVAWRGNKISPNIILLLDCISSTKI